MPRVICNICPKEFYVKPSHQKIGYGKYCSIKCKAECQQKGKFIKCDICRKKSWKMPKELKHSKSGKFFCSKSCQTFWRNKTYVGPNHANWKGGWSIYRNILIRSGCVKICKRCGNDDVRILAVHHIDQNRKNNDINNLTWLCHNCHFLIHNDRQERDKFMGTIV